ncbi:MAG TPA: YncE family protein [Bryobacteraceae bacterium]|jgi:DNA-binding beta-propeller fold protein YncE|nr:YncE family protein [Bryobacteraceae bacterium]
MRFLVLAALAPALAFSQQYRVTGSIPVGGSGGWDYLTADSNNHRLYVSHAGQVEVIDLQTDKLVGTISGMNRIHGIAIADDLNTGFISDGGSNEVVLFDLKTNSIKTKVQAGTNPDGIVYDPASQRVFAFNGRSQNATAIDARTGKVDGTIALGGKPEFPVSDGQGNVYDNIEDKNEIVQIDSKNLTVKAHWSIAPCESPSGLAIDKENRRLFAVCDEKKMAVVDADSGKVVATPAIGEGPDAAAYDPGKKLAFSSNGEGTLTVIRQKDKDTYEVVENVTTNRGARTMALDTLTHKIYLSAAEFGPAPAPTADNPRPRPSVKPGSFKVLIVSQ